MKNIAVCGLVFLVGIVLAGGSLHARKTAGSSRSHASTRFFTGEVVKVDLPSNAVEVRDKRTNKEFDVISAKFQGYDSLADVRLGDRVVVKYDKWDHKSIAKEVIKKSTGKGFSGEVTGVDIMEGTLTVQNAAGERRFDMSNALLKGYLSKDYIHAGDQVTVIHREKDGMYAAETIVKTSSGTTTRSKRRYQHNR